MPQTPFRLARTCKPPTFRWASPAVLALVVLLAAACASASDQSAGSAPKIVATTNVWADVVSGVACGDDVDVSTLIPPGGDAHGFEPSLADRASMDEAALVVANGILEEGLGDTIDSVEAGGTPVFTVMEHVDAIASSGDVHPDEENGEDEHPGDDHGDEDPHVWFDPVRVSAALPALAETLIESAGLDRSEVEACLAAYQADLAATDEMIAEILADVPPERRFLVTSHNSLSYFADRYGLEIAGTVIPASSTLAETNPAHLEELAALMASKEIHTIFADGEEPSDDAEALAERVGDTEVVTLFVTPVQESANRADGYQGLLIATARQIADGLSDRPE